MDIEWLGHSAFKVVAGKAHVLFDPFLNGNPLFSGDYDSVVSGTTHVLMTHAHNDHFGDTIDILKRTGATWSPITRSACMSHRSMGRPRSCR